jgi:hypothetical protein
VKRRGGIETRDALVAGNTALVAGDEQDPDCRDGRTADRWSPAFCPCGPLAGLPANLSRVTRLAPELMSTTVLVSSREVFRNAWRGLHDIGSIPANALNAATNSPPQSAIKPSHGAPHYAIR